LTLTGNKQEVHVDPAAVTSDCVASGKASMYEPFSILEVAHALGKDKAMLSAKDRHYSCGS
jgi:hypothetical protein